MTDVRDTQNTAETAQQDDSVDIRDTQNTREAAEQEEDVDVRITQSFIEIVHTGECPGFAPSSGGMYILVPGKTNDTIWVDQPDETEDVPIP